MSKFKSLVFSLRHFSVIKIVGVYLLFSMLWIILSDTVVAIFFSEPAKITELSLIKGIFFVVTTSILLFFLLRYLVNEIKSSEAQLEVLLKNIPDFVFFKDINGVYLACNKTTEEYFGSREADIVGKTDYDFFSKEQAEFFREKDSEAIKSGKSIKNEEWHTDPKTGEKFLLETIKTPIFDKNKNISGVLGIARDITSINDAKNTLFEKVREQERLEKIAESVPGVIYTYKVREDGTHYFPYISPLSEKYFALSSDKLQEDASCFLSLIHTDDYGNYLKSGEESAKSMSPWHGEFRYIHPEKGEIWIEGHSRPIKEDDESISWHGFAHDITHKKEAEQILRAEKDRSQRYLDTVESIIVALDRQGLITLINRKGCEILGYEKDELIGKNWFELCLPQPEGMQKVYPIYLRALSGNLTNSEYFENHVRRKSGELRLIAWHNNVLLDSKGFIIETLSSGDDITERRKMEEEKDNLQEQLNQSLKMESVGRLAGGVAHDFNNMLGVIIGYAEIASMKLASDDKIREYIDQILKAAEKSAELVRQLLTFARKQIISPKVLDLNDTVSGMLKMLRRLISEEIELVWVPGDNLWFINIDPSQVDQLLANIVVNAKDAISGVGKITIETMNISCDYNSHFFYNPEAPQGDYVMLSVTDNGCGMDDETVKRIFEPFFTTKGVGKGTGLGLATVYGIVRQNGGFINVESDLEKGTTFKIYFPRFFHESTESNVEKPQKNIYGGHEQILLVEDEKTLLNIYRENLENLGYKALAANSPNEAFLLIEKYGDKISLMVTDVIMPEMNGGELFHKIRLIFPNIKCLFISGYSADIISKKGVLHNDAYFLAKPFTIKDLSKKIREILDKG